MNFVRIFSLLLLISVSLSAAPAAQAAWVWTPQTRRWINPKYAAKGTPTAQMDWAVGFFERRDYARAVKEFIRLVQSYPKSELAPEAQYLAGVSFEQMDRPANAFKMYKRLVEIYPFSARFKEAIEREFVIAEGFFGGKKMEIVGPIRLPALEKAIEIYQHMVDHAPYGDYGDRAQLRLGECYLKQQRYEEANRAFQKVVDDYPASPLQEEAKFKVAFCARQLSLKASYDQSATEEAIKWFEEFLASHPDSELAPMAEESLRQLHDIKAQGLAQTARFYEQKGKPAAAAVYYRQIAEEYPNSTVAAAAIAKMEEFKQKGVVKE